MARLTKIQAKRHAEAEAILKKDRLTDDDRLFVVEHWQESAHHINTIAGAFFTPMSLARGLAVEVPRGRIIDLCAGIGALSLACWWNGVYEASRVSEIVCVEMNPAYVAVGRKLLPDARWIVGSVFDLPADLGPFDTAIGNPPFGNVERRGSKSPRYTGSAFELHVVDIASDVADLGVFIVPQATAPFKYSGCPAGGWPETIRGGIGSGFVAQRNENHTRFADQTGIVMEPGCGVDTAGSDGEWHLVAVRTEIVVCDFVEARARRSPEPAEVLPPPTPPADSTRPRRSRADP